VTAMGAEPIRAQSAVALGGGHGLHASLHALRRLVDDLVVDDLSAIVTVAKPMMTPFLRITLEEASADAICTFIGRVRISFCPSIV